MSENVAPKITLLAENAWLIRCVTINPKTSEIIEVRYLETPAIWNKSPAHSTIFNNHGAAENMIKCYEIISINMNPKYNPAAEIVDIVSMVDEIKHNLHGTDIIIKEGKLTRKDRG